MHVFNGLKGAATESDKEIESRRIGDHAMRELKAPIRSLMCVSRPSIEALDVTELSVRSRNYR